MGRDLVIEQALVDVRPLVMDFMSRPDYSFLLNLLGFNDLISLLLSVKPSSFDLEGPWSVIEYYCDNRNIEISNFEAIDQALGMMLMEIDYFIVHHVPPTWERGGYVFSRWLPPTTVLLKRDDF